jgi:GAF domain-containing protein
LPSAEGEMQAGPAVPPRHRRLEAERLVPAEPAGRTLGAVGNAQRRLVLSYDEPDLEIHPAKQTAGARVVVCLPLIVAEQPLGVLYVYLLEERRLSELELLLLANLSTRRNGIHHAGESIDVRRNLARKEDELTLLRRASQLISSRSRLEDTLEAILQMALEVTGARYGIFRVVDAWAGTWRRCNRHGWASLRWIRRPPTPPDRLGGRNPPSPKS